MKHTLKVTTFYLSLLTVWLVGQVVGPALAQESTHQPEPQMSQNPSEESATGPDVLGIYLDHEAIANCANLPAGEHFVYLIVTRPSEPSGIAGWECWIDIQGADNWMVLDWGLQGQAINMAPPPRFIVGLAEPLTGIESVILLEMTLLILDEGPLEFYVRPLEKSSLREHASFAAGDDPGRLVALQPASGSYDLPVAFVNGDCGPAAPWRSLKSRPE